MFHVQTEDSGIRSPHIFTHLFHEGVIIASKKLEYDQEADGDIVKGLMQAQHKSVMKELKAGVYNDKIDKYLGRSPELEAIPLDVALDEAAATIPTPQPDEGEPTGQSSPYQQILVEDEGASPGMISGTLDSHAPSSQPPMAASMPPLDIGDDDDINGLLSRLRDETPVPELLEEVTAAEPAPPPSPPPPRPPPPPPHLHAQAPSRSSFQTQAYGARPSGTEEAVPTPIEEGRGAWLVSRPGQREKPFEKSGPIPVAVPREEVHRRALTPPVEILPVEPPAESSYAQHRRQASPSSQLPAAPPAGTGVPRRPAADTRAGTNPRIGSSPRVRPPTGQFQRAQTPSRPVSIPRPPPPVLPQGQGRAMAPTPVLPRAAGPAAPSRSHQQTPVLPRAVGATSQANRPTTTAPLRSQPVTVTPRRGTTLPGDSVVVARPAVVIGAPSHIIGGPGDNSSGRHHGRETNPYPPPQENIFGQDLISEKSLDEVIMAYLSEDADDD